MKLSDFGWDGCVIKCVCGKRLENGQIFADYEKGKKVLRVNFACPDYVNKKRVDTRHTIAYATIEGEIRMLES